MFGTDPLEKLSIPDGTHVEEHDLATDGNVLVGGQSVIELGIRGGTVVAGERVTVEGDIEADGDCRLDMWCDVDGNVLVGNDAYLGERVHIAGQLIVSGDLDIGDDVEIDRGFEANGWIVIRNPMPTIVFLFVYLSHLLRVGEQEAAAEVADEFLAENRDSEPVVVPRGARVSDDTWRVSTPATIGDGCRLHGNIRAEKIDVGSDTEIFGSLRAKGPIGVGANTVVHGDVTTRSGDVVVGPGAHIRGDISCERCELSETAEIEGTIRASEGITIEDADDGSPADGTATATEDTDPEAGVDNGTTGEKSEVSSAIVPIEEGEFQSSTASHDDGTTRAYVPLNTDTDRENDTDNDADQGNEPDTDTNGQGETGRAIVPLEESDTEWESIGGGRASGNGTGDHDAIVADADDS